MERFKDRFRTGWWIWSWRIRIWGCEAGLGSGFGAEQQFGARRMN